MNIHANTQRRRHLAWLALLFVVVAILAIVAIPVWVIQPFRSQSPSGLAISYALRRWSPLVTLLGTVAALVLVVGLWRGTRKWWRRAILAMIVLPLIPATWFARQNHFEWMFNPLPNASYAKIPDATFVDDSDVVLVVTVNGEAAAYPIRFMGYHHVVQDVVGGTPIVATY